MDRELGLVIIEVKSLHLEQITSIEGHKWHVRDFYRPTISPYQQGENQLYALLAYCNQEPALRRRVAGRVLVALPLVHSSDWLTRDFHRLPSCPPLLFEDNLGRASLLHTVEDASPAVVGEPLSEEAFETLRYVVGGTSVLRKAEPAESTPLRGRAALVLQARERLHRFDLQQETIAKQIAPGPQRIRGIAGSGKTVLLCQKAAQMHLKHPDWDIALVFFTHSLYDLILDGIDRWLRRFTGGETTYDPANSKVRVLHAWGARNQPGFYREVVLAHGLRPKTVGDIPRGFSPTEGYAYVLNDLLEEIERRDQEVRPLFDALLIDEGQDLVSERFTFEGKQPFYWLAYKTLRPAKAAAEARKLFEEAAEKTDDPRRLVWAYDEAQSLDSLLVPNYKEVFGEEVARAMLSGGVTYAGGINKHESMPRCYRTPGPVLSAAHALGMRLLRPGGCSPDSPPKRTGASSATRSTATSASSAAPSPCTGPKRTHPTPFRTSTERRVWTSPPTARASRR